MKRVLRFLARLSGGPRHYKAVIYKPDRIGDFILAHRAIKSLLDHYGPENCLLVLSSHGTELAKRFFPETQVLCLETGCEIRKFRQLPVVVFEYMRLARIRGEVLISLKHHKREVDFLYENILEAEALHTILGELSVDHLASLSRPTAGYPVDAGPGLCRELEAHRLTIGKVLGKEVDAGDILPCLEGNQQEEDHAVTLISPFGSDSRRDITPGQVCRALPPDPGPLTLVGIPAQRESLEHFASALGLLAGKAVHVEILTSLDPYIDAVKRARYVITTETATAHLAIAYGRPGIGFLGGGHFGYFAPWGTGSFEWRFHRMDCFNCNWKCIHPEIRCLSDL